MRKAATLLAAITVALVLAASAGAGVRKVSYLTSVVSPNEYASLTVNVSPRARCTIAVVYASGVSKARGLGAKTGGRITWRWKVGSSTTAGRWPVRINCGKSGKLNLTLRVRR